MVTLLESCLNHNLKPSSKGEDPPHAKISSDIISCIFLVRFEAFNFLVCSCIDFVNHLCLGRILILRPRVLVTLEFYSRFLIFHKKTFQDSSTYFDTNHNFGGVSKINNDLKGI